MKLFKWQKGRRNFYYDKLKLFQLFKCDLYLIKYSKGCAVGYHMDEVKGHKHYRLNIQLRGINRLFILEDANKKMRRFTCFRADKMHSFGLTLEKGLILSFGIAVKDKKIISSAYN